MLTFLVSVLLMALAFSGIAIKILVKKDGKFAGTCSSQNPYLLGQSDTCSICGAKQGTPCKS